MSWVDQFTRHRIDLSTDSYEGRGPRSERFGHFRNGIELATGTVIGVLEEMNRDLLLGSGETFRDPLPTEVGGNYSCKWSLTWALQRSSRHRITGQPVEPVVVAVAFPPDYTHPHLGENKPAQSESVWAWPFQVTSPDDAADLRLVFEAIAAASLHERIFQADIGWRILPAAAEAQSGEA